MAEIAYLAYWIMVETEGRGRILVDLRGGNLRRKNRKKVQSKRLRFEAIIYARSWKNWIRRALLNHLNQNVQSTSD